MVSERSDESAAEKQAALTAGSVHAGPIYDLAMRLSSLPRMLSKSPCDTLSSFLDSL